MVVCPSRELQPNARRFAAQPAFCHSEEHESKQTGGDLQLPDLVILFLGVALLRTEAWFAARATDLHSNALR